MLTKQQLTDKLAQIKQLALELEEGLDNVIQTSDTGVINELALEISEIVEAATLAEKYNKRVQATYREDLTKGKAKL